MRKGTKRNRIERYDLERSPFAQNPTQLDIAVLVGESKADLKTLATPHFKEQFVVRRGTETKGKKRVSVSRENGQRKPLVAEGAKKNRDLVYPTGRLRAVHEKLNFHFSKIIQPSYLMSPRKGRAQRDNAAVHLEAMQFLTLDLKQFYPSTSRAMIRNSLTDQFGMPSDVAGFIAHLATVDDRACFGSPLTPVLASLVHRPMFDKIADRCAKHDLSYTVWVDDLTISGAFVAGELIAEIRDIIASFGLKSHKLRRCSGKKPVYVTGVGIIGANLVAPKHIEVRSFELWQALKQAQSLYEYESASARLLAHLGGIRNMIGVSSKRGQKLASEMNSIRQKRDKRRRLQEKENVSARNIRSELSIDTVSDDAPPF